MANLYAVYTDFDSYDQHLNSVHVDYQSALNTANKLAATMATFPLYCDVSIVQFSSGTTPDCGRVVEQIDPTTDS